MTGFQTTGTRETYWARVDRSGDCWIWQGHVNHKGFGVTSFAGKHWSAHRLAWHHEVGPIPRGMQVCHRCDVPACVNPSHLFLATAAGRKKRKKGVSDLDRFWSHVDPEPNSGCWLWSGAWNGKWNVCGYGRFNIDGVMRQAHRWAYEHFRGPIPDGLFACHKCDTPPCVNPDHLFLGTAVDNMADMIRKGRAGWLSKA